MRRILGLFIGLAVTIVVLLSGVEIASAQEETTVGGTIKVRKGSPDGSDLLVAGAEIAISTSAGEPIETAVTGDDGTWSVALPGAGDYQAAIDLATLPTGVALKNADKAVLDFDVLAGNNKPLIFSVESSDSAAAVAASSESSTIRIVQLTVDGIKFGLIIAMSAIGLSLIYGTTGLTNFAHGEMVTLGATVAFFLNATGIAGNTIHLILAGLVVMVLGGVFAGLFDQVIWRPLRKRGTSLISMLVVSIGISILLRYISLYWFGGRTNVYRDYTVQRVIDFRWFSMPPKDIWLIGISSSVLIVVGLLLQRTRVGKAMRAVADNRDLAESSGIDVERVIRIVWVAGGSLAALGGVLFGLTESITWDMGFRLLLLMFAGVTVGGLGTAYGALFGSILVGIFIQWSTLVVSPDMKNFGALLALVIVLLVRPQGLLGRAERIG